LVQGYPREIAAQFMKTSGETIVYFGNWTNGNLLAQEAYAYGKKVVLELDGGDFMVVWKDAPIKETVNSACRGFDLATHPCFVPRHFLIHESVFEEFVSQLLSQSSRYSSTVEADPEKGVLIPVSEMQADGTKDDNGTYVAPTIVTLNSKECLETTLSSFNKEVFFPLLTLVCFNGDEKKVVDEMITLINNNPFGLRTSVWTQETTVIESFSRDVNSMGILRFNEDHCVTPTYSSFWGGPGRSGGPYGELNLFWQKTTHLQSIDCTKLSKKELSAVLIGVGCLNLVSCS
jgi:acyl-CoA reductase-like NAD-dependent aldehyde dehydrogenase